MSPTADVDTSGPQSGHVDKMFMAAAVAAPSPGSESGEDQGEKSLNSRVSHLFFENPAILI